MKEHDYADDWIVFDSTMPDKGEEILVAFEERKGRRWVDADVFLHDAREGYYLESYGEIDEKVIAWMPIPEPYQDDK